VRWTEAAARLQLDLRLKSLAGSGIRRGELLLLRFEEARRHSARRCLRADEQTPKLGDEWRGLLVEEASESELHLFAVAPRLRFKHVDAERDDDVVLEPKDPIHTLRDPLLDEVKVHFFEINLLLQQLGIDALQLLQHPLVRVTEAMVLPRRGSAEEV